MVYIKCSQIVLINLLEARSKVTTNDQHVVQYKRMHNRYINDHAFKYEENVISLWYLTKPVD